jgi:putative transposase
MKGETMGSKITDKELKKQLQLIKESNKETSAKSRRYSGAQKDLVLEAESRFGNVEVSLLSGIRAASISVWKSRATREKTVDSSIDQSPHYEGYHKNWERVVELWKSRPGLGPAQIRGQLYREGIKISVSTVRNILEENGYTPPKAKIKSERVLRYEAARPRELSHMDFKHFYINKQKVFLLLIQDDYARFLSGYKLTHSENMDAVIEVFEESVNRYGRMQTIMTDAGSAFYSWNGFNQFQKLVSNEYGIDHIKASSPRSNGKVESVNKQIDKELLRVQAFSSLGDADIGIGEWIDFYNFERVHMGLNEGEVPADRYLYGWQREPKVPELTTKPVSNVWEDVLKLAIGKMR